MKRIVSFVLLLVSFIVVLMQPAVEVPAVPAHPIPVWSILCYLTVVAMTGFQRRENGRAGNGVIESVTGRRGCVSRFFRRRVFTAVRRYDKMKESKIASN